MVKYENLNACYFATPPVQLIMALNTSLSQFSLKMPDRFQKHYETSALFKQRLQSIGLKFVPELNDCANTLTAIRYPENINPGDLLKKIGSKGFVVAGGLYPGKQGEYFRVGHMGESCYRDDIDLVFEAIKESLKELNYKF